MTQAPRVPPRQVPTLTEVVDVARTATPAAIVAPELTIVEPTAPAAPPAIAAARPISVDEEAMTQRVLADLQRQIDLMLEQRLREALGPALARMADTLIRDTRNELSSTLRDVVAKAVAQEITRLRGR